MNLKTPQRRREPHPANLMAAVHVGRPQKRRSNRMALHAPIQLTGKDRHDRSFTMQAKATSLNRHGAAVQLKRDLLVGSVVEVQNQRGAQVPARVLAHLSALQGVSTYAIEFVERDKGAENFWGISFPTNA